MSEEQSQGVSSLDLQRWQLSVALENAYSIVNQLDRLANSSVMHLFPKECTTKLDELVKAMHEHTAVIDAAAVEMEKRTGRRE